MNGVERSNDGVKLGKCPFCGGEAYLETIPNLASNEYVVCCKNKECLGFYIGYGDVGLYGTREGAIKAWNTRKPLEFMIEQIEELKAAFEAGTYQEEYCLKQMLNSKCKRRDCNACVLERAIEIIKQEMM